MLTSPSIAHSIIIVVLLIVLACFGLAIAIELWRRRRARMQQLAAAWNRARRRANEAGLSEQQWALLETLSRKQAPTQPWQVVTEPLIFDRCVRPAIDALADVDKRDALGEQLRDIRVALNLAVLPPGLQWHSTLEMEEGQAIHARPANDATSPWEGYLIDRVNDAHFRLTPRSAAQLRNVKAGDRFQMHLWRKNDARYEFTASVVAVEPQPATLIFSHVFSLKRIQNRAHFRIAFRQPAHVAFYSVPDANAHEATTWIYTREPVLELDGVFANLSAGGFAAVMPQAPPPKAHVRVKLALDTQARLDVGARVVGTVPLSDRRCLIRAAFLELSEEQEEAISQYVFQRQRAEQQLHAADKDG